MPTNPRNPGKKRRADRKGNAQSEKWTGLFEKQGYSLDSNEGQQLFLQNFGKALEGLTKAVANMHGAGITHNHLHAGNIAVTPNGNVVLLDLGKARLARIGRLTPENAFKKFRGDLLNLAVNVAWAVHAANLQNHLCLSTDNLRRLREIILQGVHLDYPAELKEKITEGKILTILKQKG